MIQKINTSGLVGLELLRAIQKVRDSYPLPKKVADLYGEDGKLLAEYHEHRPAKQAVERYQGKVNLRVIQNNRHLIPELTPGLRQALKLPPTHSQITHRDTWAVMWVRVRDGQRVTGEKRFASLGAAILFWAMAKSKVSNATVVSRVRSYDVPSSLRGRIPRPYYWCPRCMVPRKFQKEDSDRTFSALKKRWNNEKQRFEWVERTVAYVVCPLCGCNNRDPAWRRSNQPWEVRRIKRGVTRVKRRRRR